MVLPDKPSQKGDERMTPYVALQQQIIDWLFWQVEENGTFLKELVTRFRSPGFVLGSEDIRRLTKSGFKFPSLEPVWGSEDMKEVVVKIFLEQIDDSGPEIVVRNLLGQRLYEYGTTYDLLGWVQKRGSGFNRLRTSRVAQPGALLIGDRLITGEEVISPPREGGNGTVYVHLSGSARGVWLGLPARIPLALLTPEDAVPGLIE